MCVIQKCVVNSRHTVNNVLSVYILFRFCTRYVYLMCNTKMCCELAVHCLCIYSSDSALAMCICLYNWEMVVYLLTHFFVFVLASHFWTVVFTACGDCLARCFDSRTGTLLREFKGHEGIVTNVQVARVLPPVTHAWTVVKKDSNIADFSSTPCMY